MTCLVYYPRQRFWSMEFVNERLRVSHLPILLYVTDLPLNKENAHICITSAIDFGHWSLLLKGWERVTNTVAYTVTDLPLNKKNSHVCSYLRLVHWTHSQGQRPKMLAGPICINRVLWESWSFAEGKRELRGYVGSDYMSRKSPFGHLWCVSTVLRYLTTRHWTRSYTVSHLI